MIKLNTDCLNLIFDELQKDKNSLYSCLLVNKEWCNIVVPILWKEVSWYVDDKSEKKLFNTILSCLSLTSKKLLNDNNIKLPIIKKPPIFNYISFCEFPEAEIVDNIIEMVFEELNDNDENDEDKRNLLEQEIYKLFVSQCEKIKELSWETSQPLPLFPGALKCFSKLKSLDIDMEYIDSKSLYEMSKISKNLYELFIENFSNDSGLISLIDAQKNLKSISFYSYKNKEGNCKELSKAIARKSNTINFISLTSISTITPTFLTSLNNLKFISIYNREKYDETREEIKEFQKYLSISEFPNLRYLLINRLSCFKEISMLIEKTKGNIINVEISDSDKTSKNTGILIKSISNNCPRIKILSTYLESIDFIHVKFLLLNCRDLESLRFYSLNINNENDNIGDELLDILTKYSPNSLTRIRISGSWKYSINIFEQFFDSCRERILSYFAIIPDNIINYIKDDHKSIIRKYIREGVIKSSNYDFY
ncbi:hypothetical protein RhiirC2_708830 [Rhizophagus irregularis]|uniref:F-box domain-containing protein n=1 Tax=Rhizophagus irregularis TaxID=588596 RepID=A0A2N1NKS9_9GLOM|nr:hypothetical protein RhiirC2_708830 [Rhizophagus irregularis]